MNGYKKLILLTLVVMFLFGGSLSAENYVNWKGGFWLTIPQTWSKVDYRVVDSLLMMSDTSRRAFAYQAVFAPSASKSFVDDAFLVINFDSTGKLAKAESDSLLKAIAQSYSTDVQEAPAINLLTDFVPGKPKINLTERAVSVLNEMTMKSGTVKKLWQYIRFNDVGLITLYFYVPDSTYQKNKPVFDSIVNSMSFDNLKQAAGSDTLKFTDIGGAEDSVTKAASTGQIEKSQIPPAHSASPIKKPYLYAVVILIVLALLWFVVISPRIKKNETPSE